MKRLLFAASLIMASALMTAADTYLDFGADVVSRHVWRGTDIGNTASIQPSVSYNHGNIELGASSSWAITDGRANENDLYVSYPSGSINIALTDYYFPGFTDNDHFFSFGDEDGAHTLEVSVSTVAREGLPLTALVAYNVSGDADNSLWAEATYDLGDVGDTAASVTLGVGNGNYTTTADIALVSIGLNLTKDNDYFASYIINPDKESTFLVFGRSF